MPEQDPPTNEQTPRPKLDRFTAVGLSLAAVVAAMGMIAMVLPWWQSGITDTGEILRLASQEFIAGRPIIAGDLAETAIFHPGPDALGEDTDTNTDGLVADQIDQAAADAPATTDPRSGDATASPESDTAADPLVTLRNFLVGAGKLAQAQNESDRRTRHGLLNDAVGPLRASFEAGFPEGRKTQGLRMLGTVLHELGQHEQAIAPLQETVSRDPTQQRVVLPLIAEANLRKKSPDPSAALALIQRFLNDRGLQSALWQQGQLIRLRALTQLGRYEDFDRVVNQIRSVPPVNDAGSEAEAFSFGLQVDLLAAIRLVKQQIQRQSLVPEGRKNVPGQDIAPELRRAITQLTELGREATPRISSQAKLWQARALQLAGRDDEALIQLTTVRQQRPFGVESTVAGLEEIQWLADRGRGVEVLQTVRYLMRELGDTSFFDEELIRLEEFRRRLLESLAALRRAGDYSAAVDTARSLPPIVELAEALTQEGIAYDQWAESVIAEGTDANGELSRAASALARSRYRASGDAYAAAAQQQFDSGGFVAAQWRAIEAYQKGRHFRRSIDLLEDYLRYEQRGRLPRGLVAYGRALLAEGQIDEAIKALESCIVEHPRDPLRYDARLMVAKAKIEQGKPDQATRYLTENLQDGDLTPASPAWQNSLFTIAELHYDLAYRKHTETTKNDPLQRSEELRQNQPNIQQAILYLDQAVARYWPQRRAESAAYMSARAHVMAAELPRAESQSDNVLDSARRSMEVRADRELQVAVDGFSSLKRHLLAREEESALQLKELRMLRNCFMAEAETLRQMNRLEEAVRAYRTIELRYINEPLVLEAISNRAACVRSLGRGGEADLLIQQAAVILDRIPTSWNGRFSEVTRFDRDGWREHLTWLNQRSARTGAS